MINPKPRLVVLISGNGSNLQSILNACQSGALVAEVVAVISNRPEAFGLERACKAGIPALVCPKSAELDRKEYDRRLAEMTCLYYPDWVVLAGWMRLLSMDFLSHFPGKVINIHPALPGKYPGTHAIERAWEDFKKGKIDHTGVMIHLVPDEGVDCGPVLNQLKIPILPEDTLETLEARIHAVEHWLYVETLRELMLRK